jgi:hypothetical protein
MKKGILFAALALLISAGVTAQTQTRQQLKTQNQTQLLTQSQDQNQVQIQQRKHLQNQTCIQTTSQIRQNNMSSRPATTGNRVVARPNGNQSRGIGICKR